MCLLNSALLGLKGRRPITQITANPISSKNCVYSPPFICHLQLVLEICKTEKGKNTKISAMNSKDWETWRGSNHSNVLLKNKWFYLPAKAK